MKAILRTFVKKISGKEEDSRKVFATVDRKAEQMQEPKQDIKLAKD